MQRRRAGLGRRVRAATARERCRCPSAEPDAQDTQDAQDAKAQSIALCSCCSLQGGGFVVLDLSSTVSARNGRALGRGQLPRAELGEDPVEASTLGGVQARHAVDVAHAPKRPRLPELIQVVLRHILHSNANCAGPLSAPFIGNSFEKVLGSTGTGFTKANGIGGINRDLGSQQVTFSIKSVRKCKVIGTQGEHR